MPKHQQDNSQPNEAPNLTGSERALDSAPTKRLDVGFIPLYPEDPSYPLGYRANATQGELLDAATHRQNAVIGALRVLSDSPNLDELDSRITGQCLEAILILITEARALYLGAFEIQP